MSFTREPIGTRHPQIDPLQALSYIDRMDTEDLQRQHLQQSIFQQAGTEASNRRAMAHGALARDVATSLGITPEEADKHISRLPRYEDLITQYESAFQPKTETQPTGIFGWGQKNVMVPPSGVTQGLRERTAEGARGLAPSIFQSTQEQATVAGGGQPLESTDTGRAYLTAQMNREARGEAPLSPKEFTAGLAEGRLMSAEAQQEKVRPYALRKEIAGTTEVESKARVQEASEPAQKLIAQATLDAHRAQAEHSRLAGKVEAYKLGEVTLPSTSPLAQETAMKREEHKAILEYHRTQAEEAKLKLQHAKDVDAAIKRGDIKGALQAAGIGGLEAQLRMEETRSVHVRQTLDDLLKAKINLATEKDVGRASTYASQTNYLALEIAKTTGARTMEVEVVRGTPGMLWGTTPEKFSASEVPIVVGEAYLTNRITPQVTDSLVDQGSKGAWLTYINHANEFKHATDGTISITQLHKMVESLRMSPQATEEAFKNLIANPFIQRKMAPVKR